MIIQLSPQRRDDGYTLTVFGEVLSIDGATLDLSGIPEGATLPRGAVDCPWLAGDITREGGVLRVPLILPHGAIPLGLESDPEVLAVTFPAPITVTGDGPVALPAIPEMEGEE